VANKNVMAIYLWQMVPVVVVALVGYPTGLLPQPQAGSGAWWLFRGVWLVILASVLAAELVLLWLARAVFSRALPTFVIPLPAWSTTVLLIAGIGVVTVVLARFSVDGFAPGGRFPTVDALLYVAAIGMLGFTRRGRPEPTARRLRSRQAPPAE
jgi:hypothetical protein